MYFRDEAVLLCEWLELFFRVAVDVHRGLRINKLVVVRQITGQRLFVQFNLLLAKLAGALELKVSEELAADVQRQAAIDVRDRQLLVLGDVFTGQHEAKVSNDLIAAVALAAVVEKRQSVEQGRIEARFRDAEEMANGLDVGFAEVFIAGHDRVCFFRVESAITTALDRLVIVD